MSFVYLDHAALTPMPAGVAEEMTRAASLYWGHPSAVHASGRRARARLEQARDQVAALVGCPPGQIEWYGSGTEALAEAMRTTLSLASGPVVCARIEHPSVLERVAAMEEQGRAVHWLEAPAGEPDPAAVAAATNRGDAVLIFAPLNHEMGTAPAVWAAPPTAQSAWSIVDAVQAAAWMDLRPYLADRSWIVVASHKLGGPPGAAALRVPPDVDRRRHPAPGQGGMTPWLAAIGMGIASDLRRAAVIAAAPAVRAQATELVRRMQAVVPSIRRNGGASWLGPILSVSVPGVPGRALEAALDLRGICISRTAACRQGSTELAPAVHAAYPGDPTRAREATRWSLGCETTPNEIDMALAAWRDAIVGLMPSS
jgi:cysteine desulfurase